jgi:hypothetical protein
MSINYKYLVRHFIFLTIALSVIGCGLVSDIEKENIRRVKNLNSNEVASVTIYETKRNYKTKKKMIIVLEKYSEIDDFINSLRTIKRVHLNHPRFPNRWAIEIKFKDKKKKIEKLKIFQRIGYENRLYVRCLGHRWLGSAATTVSFDFYDWMNKNIGID